MRTTTALRTALLAVAIGSAVLAGCSGTEDDSASDVTADPAPLDPVAAANQLTPEEILEMEQTNATDPRIIAEREAQPDTDKIDFTQQARLTDDGPVPATAVAILGEPCTFVNETADPVSIQFTNGGVGESYLTQTDLIAPGDTFDVVPDRAVSIKYAYAEQPDLTGQIQVETLTEAG